jgi:hypothetical protein
LGYSMIHDQLPQWATSAESNVLPSMCIIFMMWFLYYFIIRLLVYFLFHVSTDTTETYIQDHFQLHSLEINCWPVNVRFIYFQKKKKRKWTVSSK